MKLKLIYKRFIERVINLVVKSGKDALALHYVSDEIILAALQADGRLAEIHDPLAHVNFLRDCIQPLTFSIRELKGKEDLDSVESKRFATLLFSLQSGLPPPSIFLWPKRSAWLQIDTALFICRLSTTGGLVIRLYTFLFLRRLAKKDACSSTSNGCCDVEIALS